MVEKQERVDLHLAFRTEGQCFNAYVEREGTKPFIQLVGSINKGMSESDPLTYGAWRHLMTLAVMRMAERLSGEPVQLIDLGTVKMGGRA